MLLPLFAIALLFCATVVAGTSGRLRVRDDEPLQHVITWDEYSFMINGTRLYVFSGEVHPYRMPVQSLHLDIFQKVKSAGLNAVSFYTFWGILEPKKGEISFEGFRNVQIFMDAAKEAGLYLIARPGPYINAETTAGGFPGWGTYDPALWRTSNTSYVESYQLYFDSLTTIVAENEVAKGGPIILIQSENEYSGFEPPYHEDKVYEHELINTIRANGVTIPITTNDVAQDGIYTIVDVYGYDSYAIQWDCTHPYTWPSDVVPETFFEGHLAINPQEPNVIYEHQGGSYDGWGGSGYYNCSILTGPDYQRVFYKNAVSMAITYQNLYMIYGGTNWGGIAHPGVYTSYDYGAAIAEDRTLREKYYDLKLQTNFYKVSPALLTSRPDNYGETAGAFTNNTALETSQSIDAVGNLTGFYTIRQANASSFEAINYTISLPTSLGTFDIPILGGSLTLSGKDSKIHVTDYEAGSTTLLYSTAEIMTWATFDERDVIVLYGNAGELHETAILFDSTPFNAALTTTGTSDVVSEILDDVALVLQYMTDGQTVVELGSGILLYILDRTTAYEFWVLHPPAPEKGSYANYSTDNPVIIKGGYFLRSISIDGGTLNILGDLNATADFEIIGPSNITEVTFNGASLDTQSTSYGTLQTGSVEPDLPEINLPDLSALTWKTANSLPEILSNYSDDLWTVANHTKTVNKQRLYTPVVLISGDYGYHTGNHLWRAHFNASGTETGFAVDVWGGAAFGFSVWLDDTFLGSWEGDAIHSNYSASFGFPDTLDEGSEHIITILQDHMGYEEDWTVASDDFKTVRGITSYNFTGSADTEVSVWKLTGNLGGESYIDTTRGPLNEGGLYGERQGWHLPGFDDSDWDNGSPLDGIDAPGVSFYRTTFDLDVPSGVDYPLAIVVSNSTDNPYYRSQFYVNGYQFGKYINSIGPQTSFPVPQGILDYGGTNTLAISLWAHGAEGASLNSLALELTATVASSMAEVQNQPFTPWSPRLGAY
ncbi:glycoside hydrolase family 35 protein [Fistulina hepatica ATCC 64428]|uniref:Beta-galactosidase n=1 Tax=Fistulina hepatica ATCC 64428 TaxID=1128425 RepID=A0A0D7A7N5_9AGAR|nr:glycoside hydrolase family 35 protein [Fistulina hepatica ATCC 64428]